MTTLGGLNSMRAVRRTFATSQANFVRRRSNAPSELFEVGRIEERTILAHYKPGQLFLHGVFAYRAAVLCSFDCKVVEKAKPKDAMDNQLTVPFYQVLIHRDDWNHMGFADNMTSYLTSSGSGREDKILTTIQGMDCVEHTDIIPLSPPSRSVVDAKQPIDHDMFFRLFQPDTDSEGPRFEVKPDFAPALNTTQKSWLAPIAAHKQTTEGVQVMVVVFYLGTNIQSGQQRHVWRYTIRVHNTDKERTTLTLRERVIKVYSLSNMQQSSGPGVNGTGPQLTKYRPAYQFSSVVALPSAKGSHMWGTFKMEREDGSVFEVAVPTVSLEVTDSAAEKSENALL